jgi:glycosyltransferase involved in cell wall biosynthesis/SAM-dependent methyltransferase
MSADDDVPVLPWTGERYVPQVEGHNIRLEHLHRYLLAREISHAKRVLDIACGEGYGSAILSTVAAHVIGVDIAADVVQHATVKYGGPHVEFRQGSCESIPLDDRSVDIVVSFETIEHISAHEEMMREIRRVLRADGRLIISSPDRRQYSAVEGNQNPYHVRELDRDEFEQLLGRHFAHVTLIGQRVRSGSLVGPLDPATPTTFVSFPSTGENADAVPGILDPQYLLAVASDTATDRVPVGLLDGGPFAWATDLGDLLSKVQGQCAVEIARRLGEAIQLDGATSETIRVEFTRQADRVSEAVRRIVEQEERLVEQEERLVEQEERLVEQEEWRRGATQRLAELEAVQREVAALRVRLEDLRLYARAAQQKVRSAHEHIPSLRSRILALERQVDVYQHSRSWRITAPLRALRRGASEHPVIHEPLKDIDLSPLPELHSIGESLSFQAQVELRSGAADNGPSTQPRRTHDEPTSEYVPLERAVPVETRIKLIAFYLPQFHPIPENDRWWGKGFTEWTSVTRGKPQFEGHHQPRLPGELGFYDLRLPEVQHRQIELARLHGVHGFCYYHYWFQGKKLLHQPLNQLLARPELDFPFCVCWANESWTRRWDGADHEILIAQHHSPDDDLAFIRDIEPALRDARYIRIDNRFLLLVYRPELFDDGSATAERWRTYCRSAGIGELYLVSVQAFGKRDPREFGFDAALEFAPNNIPGLVITDQMRHLSPGFEGVVYDYRHLVATAEKRPAPEGYPLFRSVTPTWDNEARRPGRGTIYAHSSPELYQKWLMSVCRWTETHVGVDKPFVFVNAWNEWAEGAHLEPDRRHGYAYLNATADALAKFPPLSSDRPFVVLVSHDAYFHGAQVLTLNLARTLTNRLHYHVEVLLCGPGPLVEEFESVTPVHHLWSPECTAERKRALAQQLYDRGARVAICNTSVVGECVEMLKGAGFSVVSVLHELPGLIGEHQLERSVERIIRDADRLVFPAEIVKDNFAPAARIAERSVVRPQGLFAPNQYFGRRESARRELRAQLGLAPDAPIVLSVGYGDRRKGIDLFAEVGVRVAQRRRDVAFVWVGHHEQQAFVGARSIIERAGVSNPFQFPGPIRDADLFFAGADVYLLTSREDPFPSVVLQGLDAELPIVGFEGGGGFAELLRRGCGVLVPLADVAAMSAATLRLLDAPEERAQLASIGREILSREFSFVNYARSLVELVRPVGPAISAVVPNYNYARHLRARLESIINQTYPPHEVLFLDDCSSDNSVAVASEILHRSGLSYRIITNSTNQGTYRQWLRGLREAKGDLVWIAEADDDCAPRLLEVLSKKFEQPRLVLAYCQSKQIDEAGRELSPDYLEYTAEISETKWRDGYDRPGVDEIRDTLVIKNTIPNVSAVLMRRVDLSGIEQRLVGLKNAGDWLLYTHLLEGGNIAFVPEALNFHRRHASSVTIGKGGLNLMREILIVQQHLLEKYSIAPGVERQMELSLQRTYEYLGLGANGPASYKDHGALREVQWAETR